MAKTDAVETTQLHVQVSGVDQSFEDAVGEAKSYLKHRAQSGSLKGKECVEVRPFGYDQNAKAGTSQMTIDGEQAPTNICIQNGIHIEKLKSLDPTISYEVAHGRIPLSAATLVIRDDNARAKGVEEKTDESEFYTLRSETNTSNKATADHPKLKTLDVEVEVRLLNPAYRGAFVVDETYSQKTTGTGIHAKLKGEMYRHTTIDTGGEQIEEDIHEKRNIGLEIAIDENTGQEYLVALTRLRTKETGHISNGIRYSTEERAVIGPDQYGDPVFHLQEKQIDVLSPNAQLNTNDRGNEKSYMFGIDTDRDKEPDRSAWYEGTLNSKEQVVETFGQGQFMGGRMFTFNEDIVTTTILSNGVVRDTTTRVGVDRNGDGQFSNDAIIGCETADEITETEEPLSDTEFLERNILTKSGLHPEKLRLGAASLEDEVQNIADVHRLIRTGR